VGGLTACTYPVRFLAALETNNLQSFHKFLTNYATSCPTLEAMTLMRRIITIVCMVASFIANAGEQLTANAKSVVNQPTTVELQLLQGAWEGVLVGDKAQQKITIMITGNSLHFHRDTNFWFDTTITLPAGKDPKQLHATIKGCPPSQGDSIGKVVRAFFKIEDGTLTLATLGDNAEETPNGFEAAPNRYELRKVQPQKKNTQPPKTK
jgi:uncharacterized protein (TIGR03067 family)